MQLSNTPKQEDDEDEEEQKSGLNQRKKGFSTSCLLMTKDFFETVPDSEF
jgi:hypothetical protein